jgi:hypothetical protein
VNSNNQLLECEQSSTHYAKGKIGFDRMIRDWVGGPIAMLVDCYAPIKAEDIKKIRFKLGYAHDRYYMQ